MKNVSQEIGIRRHAHRLLAWITLLSLIPFPASPTRAFSIEWGSDETLIERQALAPPAAGVLRTFDPVRVRWVRLEEGLAPAPDTPIHGAIREVERLLERGEHRHALILADVLAYDVAMARHASRIHDVMEWWSGLFPVTLPLDVTRITVDQLDRAVDALLRSMWAPQNPAHDLFMERIWRARFDDPESPAVIRGFETFMDLHEALAHTLDWEATFKIRIPPEGRKWVENHPAVSVTVSGPRTVGWLMATTENLYPRLKTVGWLLRIDRRIQMDTRKAVDPAQRFALVLPRSA